MSIRVLPTRDQLLIGSSVQVPSFNIIVKNLIANSLDSNATKINITFDIEDFETLIIEDDGDGISPECLCNIGLINHYTHKYMREELLDPCRYFGFKGTFLFSLNQSCESIDIITRRKQYNATWKFNSRTNSTCILSETDIPMFREKCCGSLFKINKIYNNFPVRLKVLKKIHKNILIQQIKKTVLDLMATCTNSSGEIHLNIDFFNSNIQSLNYKFYEKSALACEGVDSMNIKYLVDTFQKVFPNLLDSQCFKNISTRFKHFEISGIFSSTGIPTNSYQFVYLNKWCFNKNQEIQAWLRKVNRQFESIDNFDSNKFLTKSIGNPYRTYPILVLVIRCNTSLVDFSRFKDPENESLNEYKHLSLLISILDKIIESFFKHIRPQFEAENKSNTIIPVYDKLESKFDQHTSKMVLNSKIKRARLDHKEINGLVTNTFETLTNNIQVSSGSKLLKYSLSDDVSKTSSAELQRLKYKFKGVFHTDTTDYNFEDVLTLSKSDLVNHFVISQVDKKFILLKLSKQEKLCIIDQHACDERIKLERLLQEFILSDIPVVTISDTAYGDIRITSLNDFEISLFEIFFNDFMKWGIQYTLTKDLALNIKTLPRVLYEKIKHSIKTDDGNVYDLNFLKNGLLKHIYDLDTGIKRRVQFSSKNTVDKNWWLQVQTIPTVLLEIFNSKACRSAVMFGNELTINECQNLINKLSECNMPFHCAHGRPSIIPLKNIHEIFNNNSDTKFIDDYKL